MLYSKFTMCYPQYYIDKTLAGYCKSIRGLGYITKLVDYSGMLFKELYYRQDS